MMTTCWVPRLKVSPHFLLALSNCPMMMRKTFSSHIWNETEGASATEWQIAGPKVQDHAGPAVTKHKADKSDLDNF